MDQNTAEWLKMRKNYIGASDAPIIMGKSKWRTNDGRVKTPHLLWEDKLGLLDAHCDNAATRYGKQMEAPAREAYEKETGIFVVPEIVFHKEVNYMMSSLDGLSLDRDIAVEIKNANAEDHSVAREKRVPDHYYPQVQHQLACLNHDVMHYFSFHKGEGIVVEVKRDIDYLQLLYEREHKFWECVRNMQEPDLNEMDFRIQCSEWETKAKRLWEAEENLRINTKLAKELKDDLKRLSQGYNSKRGSFRFVSSIRRGSIDYSLIPELKNRDLECFRKPPSQMWSLQRDQ